MSWQDSKASVRDDILFLPTSARTVSQAEIDALEAKRIRRLRELGNWRPSRGWHIEPALPPAESAAHAQSRTAVRALRSAGADDTAVLLRMSGARQSLHRS